jgi:hypothetical protein
VLPSRITNKSVGFALNGQTPLVRQQLNEAAARVVRLLEGAKRFDEAQNLRDKFIKQYSIPAEVFSKKRVDDFALAFGRFTRSILTHGSRCIMMTICGLRLPWMRMLTAY